MNDVIKNDNSTAIQKVTTSETKMINIIAGIAKDPATDVEKIEKLLDIQLKMIDRQSKIDFDLALSKVQAEMPRISARGSIKNKSGIVTSRYLKYEDIDKEIRPLLQKHGFSLVHSRTHKDDKMIVSTTLKHSGGHEISVQIPLPYDQPNLLKNNVQAAVSTFSYGKRINVCSLLNIVAEDEDDDGQNSEAMTINTKQAEEIERELDYLNSIGINADKKKFLAYLGVQEVKNIPVKKLDLALDLLNRKKGSAYK